MNIVSSTNANCWLAPVKGDKNKSAEEVIQTLVGNEGIFGFGERTPARKRLRPGDLICFYAKGSGIVAHAEVASSPREMHRHRINMLSKYPRAFSVKNVELYLNNPNAIDSVCRGRLEAFRDRDPNAPWGWFVLTTRRISNHDFKILTSAR